MSVYAYHVTFLFTTDGFHTVREFSVKILAADGATLAEYQSNSDVSYDEFLADIHRAIGRDLNDLGWRVVSNKPVSTSASRKAFIRIDGADMFRSEFEAFHHTVVGARKWIYSLELSDVKVNKTVWFCVNN